MAASVVLVDRPAPQVARLLINRPQKRNAIDHAVRQALIDALATLRSDRSVRALVFGGVGGLFSAGGDLPSMAGLDEAGARARMQHIHRLCRAVTGAGLPVVSVVEGVAAGAAVGLALLGQQIVMAEDARLLFPFLKLGLTPDWGQLSTLPRRVGLAQARRILTSGAAVGAEEALRIGLVDQLAAADAAMALAVTQAQALAKLPQGAFARMNARLDRPSASLEEEFAREEEDQAVCLAGAEFREGFRAFEEKREPDFLAPPEVPA